MASSCTGGDDITAAAKIAHTLSYCRFDEAKYEGRIKCQPCGTLAAD